MHRDDLAFRIATLLVVATTGCMSAAPDDPNQAPDDTDVAVASEALSSPGERGFALIENGLLNPTYSFNGRGGGIGASTVATGTYFVKFGGFTSSEGNVQVVAYGNNPTRCKATGWNQGTIGVLCHGANGQLANGSFVVSYNNDLRTQGGTAGFMLTNGTATPPATWSYNSTGQANSVAYLGKGQYFAQFTGMSAPIANAQVTAVGTDNLYCKITGWGPSQGNTLVGVQCFDPNGRLTDSLFSLQLIGQKTPEAWNRAFAWSDQLTKTNYVANTSFQYHSLWDSNTLLNTGFESTGRYFVVIRDMQAVVTPTTAMVTAVGTDGNYCKPVNWHPDTITAAYTELEVACFTSSGAPANSTFASTYISQEPPACTAPPCGAHEHVVVSRKTVREDNPRLTGYAYPDGWSWSVDANNNETYGGRTGSEIWTTPAALVWGMNKNAFVPSLPSGTSAEVYRQNLTNWLPPWVSLPTNCTSMSQPACAAYANSTFPFWAPGIELPRDHSGVVVTHQNLLPGTEPYLSRFVNETVLNLDPAVPVVPVHVHVIQDAKGHVPSRYAFPFSITDRAEAAWQIRQLFDQAVAKHAWTTWSANTTSVSMKATRALDPLASRTFASRFTGAQLPFYADDIFAQCGVQLRLESVSFIKQNLGLENDLVPVGQSSSTVLCSSSRATPLVNAVLASYNNQTTIPRGIHIFVGGWIEHNTDVQARGVSCIGPRYSFIDAGGTGTFRTQTIFHEIGHVLSQMSGHSSPSNVDSLMCCSDGTSPEGTLLDPSWCGPILQTARQY